MLQGQNANIYGIALAVARLYIRPSEIIGNTAVDQLASPPVRANLARPPEDLVCSDPRALPTSEQAPQTRVSPRRADREVPTA